MRGEPLHNMMANGVETTLCYFFNEVHLEHPYRKNGVVTFLDLFARQNQFVLACEIETTTRHGVDNARKAAAVDIPLWIIVPTNQLKIKLSHKLKPFQLRPGGESIKILLLGQLQGELENYLSLKPLPNQQADISATRGLKGGNWLCG